MKINQLGYKIRDNPNWDATLHIATSPAIGQQSFSFCQHWSGNKC